MKKIFVTILILQVCNQIYSQILNPTCGNWSTTSWPSIANCNTFESGDWVLVFSDEFENNQVDRTKWFTLGGGWNREHGDELQYYLDQNISFNNGILNLIAKREPGYYDVFRWDENGNGYITQKYFEYTSGYIETKMKFEYGFFEIRCKIPYGKGFWPAFWLYGFDDVEGEGPEIDIFEFAGDEPNNHYITLHKWWKNGLQEKCISKKDYGIDFSSDFHTFSAEWDEFKIVYRVDGDIKRIDFKYFDMRPVGLYDCQHHVPGFYTVNPIFPTKPASVILNLAISCQGCDFGRPPNSATVFPSSLEVDYIHIYRRKNPSKDIYLCGFDYANESSTITGKTITVGGTSCNSVIESNKSVFLFATEQISLLPGFWAELGSNFSAKTSTTSGIQKSAIFSKENSINEKRISFDVLVPIVEDSYKVYPNPNSGSFKVELIGNINDFQRIEVIDINGKIIFQSNKMPNNNLIIDLSNYSKGVYLLQITFKNKKATNKIIYQ